MGLSQDLYTATCALRISRRKKRFLCRCRTMIIAGVCYSLLNPCDTTLNYLWKLVISRNVPDDWKKEKVTSVFNNDNAEN